MCEERMINTFEIIVTFTVNSFFYVFHISLFKLLLFTNQLFLIIFGSDVIYVRLSY
jgi:hypothetical protein